jgi:hypothetical protein
MEANQPTHPSARARRGAHTRAKGEAPWWERMGEAPPGVAVVAAPAGPAAAKRRRAHPGVIAGLLLVVMALPLLAFGHGSKGGPKVATQRAASQIGVDTSLQVDAAVGAGTEAPTTEAPTTAAPTTAAPTTAAPTTAAPTTVVRAAQTAAPVTALKATSAPKPAPATTTPPPPPPPPAPAAAPRRSQSGQGTWYRYQAGGCANNNLPMGTVVTVTNVDNGATTTCVVNDRGGFSYPRILDMDVSVFQQLAPLSSGVINISISW